MNCYKSFTGTPKPPMTKEIEASARRRAVREGQFNLYCINRDLHLFHYRQTYSLYPPL